MICSCLQWAHFQYLWQNTVALTSKDSVIVHVDEVTIVICSVSECKARVTLTDATGAAFVTTAATMSAHTSTHSTPQRANVESVERSIYSLPAFNVPLGKQSMP